jgi:toxin YhaV
VEELEGKWTVYLSESVLRIYRKLQADSIELMKRDPANKSHPKVRDFKNLQKAIRDVISNPFDKCYLLGGTLGEKHKHWRRIKRDMPERYRFFFRFFSATRDIYFVWINDAQHIRREGHRNDVYKDFQRRLESGDVPEEREDLGRASIEFDQRELVPEDT